MGLLDDAKDQAAKLLDGHEEQVKDGIDKAAEALEGKIGHGDTIDTVADKAKSIVDELGK